MDVELNKLKDEDCPVDDLLYLIKQDSVEQLRNALLDVINNVKPGGEIYLYQHGYSVYNSSSNNFSPTLIACRSGDKNCIEKSQLLQLSSDSESIQFEGFKYLPTEEYVQVFTIESERSNRGLLITINTEIINEDYINTLINAYDSLVYLLRNKDTDSLTGLLNRQSFDTKLLKFHQDFGLEKRSADMPCQFCFALFDIDFFKTVNDKYGHVYGDEVLILFADIMKKTFRDEDLLFRYGGEEFAVLLKDVNLQQADSILNRFREDIENFSFPMENTITTSIGYCEFTNKIPLSSIIEHADKALYYSKEHGRNKTSRYETLLANNDIKEITINEGNVEIF